MVARCPRDRLSSSSASHLLTSPFFSLCTLHTLSNYGFSSLHIEPLHLWVFYPEWPLLTGSLSDTFSYLCLRNSWASMRTQLQFCLWILPFTTTRPQDLAGTPCRNAIMGFLQHSCLYMLMAIACPRGPLPRDSTRARAMPFALIHLQI